MLSNDIYRDIASYKADYHEEAPESNFVPLTSRSEQSSQPFPCLSYGDFSANP